MGGTSPRSDRSGPGSDGNGRLPQRIRWSVHVRTPTQGSAQLASCAFRMACLGRWAHNVRNRQKCTHSSIAVSFVAALGLFVAAFSSFVALVTRMVQDFNGVVVCVTGAGGYVGWKLCHTLISLRAEKVRAFDVAFTPQQRKAVLQGWSSSCDYHCSHRTCSCITAAVLPFILPYLNYCSVLRMMSSIVFWYQ
jgi:hypothetical protein